METSTFSGVTSMLPGGVRPIDHTPDENEFQMTLIPSTRIIFMFAKFDKQSKVIRISFVVSSRNVKFCCEIIWGLNFENLFDNF